VGLRVIELFAGIGAQAAALERLGIVFFCDAICQNLHYYTSEAFILPRLFLSTPSSTRGFVSPSANKATPPGGKKCRPAVYSYNMSVSIFTF